MHEWKFEQVNTTSCRGTSIKSEQILRGAALETDGPGINHCYTTLGAFRFRNKITPRVLTEFRHHLFQWIGIRWFSWWEMFLFVGSTRNTSNLKKCSHKTENNLKVKIEIKHFANRKWRPVNTNHCNSHAVWRNVKGAAYIFGHVECQPGNPIRSHPRLYVWLKQNPCTKVGNLPSC